MKTTSLRISGFFPSPSLCSPKLDRHLRLSFLLYTIFACSFGFSSTKADLNRNLEVIEIPKSVTVQEAHEMLLAGHSYLDVRTPDEFEAGHPPGAINIPYMNKIGSDMTKNANFVAEVSSRFRKDDEILVGCKIGKRSIKAATDLVSAGFSAITNVAGGFDAWVENGLPIEY